MKHDSDRDYPENISTGFIAECCGVSTTTVLRWIRKGYLKAFRLPDGHYRINRKDLAVFLKKYHMPLKRQSRGKVPRQKRP